MLWVKRIVCGIVALVLIICSIKLFQTNEQAWQALGCCLLISGITLAHIAIFQQLPKYNFWITLIAIGLAFILYSTNYRTTYEEAKIIENRLDNELEKSKNIETERLKSTPIFAPFSGFSVHLQIELSHRNKNVIINKGGDLSELPSDERKRACFALFLCQG